MALDLVELMVLMRGVAQFVGDAEKVTAATTEVGAAAETSGKKAGTTGWKGMMKYAIGFAAIYKGAKFVQSAISTTEDLAKATRTLQKITGMDTVTSSEWVNVAKERGVSARQLQTSFVMLSKQMNLARGGTETETKTVKALRSQIDALAAAGGPKAAQAMQRLSGKIATAQAAGEKARKTMNLLGIPLEDLQKGKTGDVMLRVADAFKTIQNPAQRAAIAQQLFGRSGLQLLPILSQGREKVQELLDEQKKAGNYLTDKGLKSQLAAVQAGRELEQATGGLKTSLAQALVPALIAVTKGMNAFMRAIRPLTAHPKLMAAVIYGIVAALIALKVATIATTIAEKENTMATKAWAAAQWLLNAALDANPLVLAAIAVVALGVAFYEAYKHVKWFRDFVNQTWAALVKGAKFVWNWVKANWPYLAAALIGPFALFGVFVWKHWDQIKQWTRDLVGFIKNEFNSLLDFVKTLPKRIGGWIKKIPGGKHLLSAAGWVGSKLAAGGVVSRPGTFMVGERGPEVLALPAGAAVSPIPAGAALGGGGFAAGGFEVVVPVYLDRQMIARAVAQVTADKLARR